MFLLNFLRYLRGYVWFEVRGGFIERFLNLAARNRITIWSGRKRGDVYGGCVAARDYRHLRGIAKQTGVRLRISGKHGLPFHRQRYRRRTGLLAGAAIFFAFVFGMAQFIWRIEIRGNDRASTASILQALESLEIAPGTLRRSIDIRDSERKMLLLVPDLSWVALNMDGSTIHVEVSESSLPPPMIDPKTPCNVVAREAGQIIALHVFEGQALVKEGDTVLPGDLIVSGITQDGREQTLYRHARAQVIAETTLTLEAASPLQQTAFIPTGKQLRRHYLGIFGVELPVFLPWSTPSPYRVERALSPLRIASLELPVYWLREEYIFMREVPRTLTEEEAKLDALAQLENLEKTQLTEAEILDRRITGELRNGTFYLWAEYDCRIDIAHKQEIRMQTAPDEN